ncbi:putative inorganic phosphate cotransporter isoform X2 [Tribolium castaneum]|uniref:putative inorganic phosphate cotransporter isoform X2 n=1 Tax=Tribolium castaneum TaxID=7070 RepID=UPI00077DC741|nr:PREDICTED: putative inorganic phosphate cotransporter isoform X2 [Tribolium castaneum]|eukprot:XP_015838264.1 PREDICTED: putative inorganic phosphate cotransporter isoform X2 [Tribolium castaneum]
MVKLKAPPYRVWIAVMIFMTTFTNYMLRANMSVSIISMVDKAKKNQTAVCATPADNSTKPPPPPKSGSKKFKWSETDQGWILAAYFYGYFLTLMPGGLISNYIGPWHVLLWTGVGSAVLTGLTPICATSGGVGGVCANRFFIGFLGGPVYPAVNDLIAKWAPPKEKGKFLAAMMGNTLGTVLTWLAVAAASSAWGWEWGFYVLAIFMLVFCATFGIVVRDRPDVHPWVSDDEKKHIFEAQEGHLTTKKGFPPYHKMLCFSIPFWALVIAQFGNAWGLNLIITYVPKFMAETLGFNIKASAGLAALPYIGRLLGSSVFGVIVDYMRKKEVMSVTKIRKLFITFSHFIPGLCLILIRAFGCIKEGVIAMLVLNQGFNGACVVSQLVNPQDLSPNFAGAVFGIMNFFGMTTGLFVPKITGYLNTTYDLKARR